MTIPSLLTLKAITLVLGTLGAVVFVVDQTVKVAIIVSIPPTISSLMWGWVNHKKLSTVESNTDGTLTQIRTQLASLQQEKQDATSRADRAEARTEGDQDRESKSKL